MSSTVVTSPEATTALLETEITGVASSSTVVTTPASQSIGTETDEQDLTNHDPQPSNNYEMSTPSSASLVLENHIASTPASFVMNPCSASSCTSGASVVSTPLSTAYSCKECAHKARKKHNLLRANKRLKMKVRTLKEEVSSLKLTITELESVSFIYLHLFTINIFCNLCLIFTIRVLYVYILIYPLAWLPCIFFHPLSKIMTRKYFLLFCFTLALTSEGNGERR